MKRIHIIVFYIVALFLVTGCVPACFAVDVVEATEAVNQAESSLNLAFEAVSDAHDSGANIKGLLENLIVAGDFLSEAQIALRSGDYETAISFAAECDDAVEDLAAEANHTMINAERENNDLIILTVAGSGIGLIILLILSLIGWKLLRKRYHQRVLGMKPELRNQRESK